MNIKLNPVFRKELKLTTRTWKIAMTIFVYAGVLALIGLFVFSQMLEDLAYSMSYQSFTQLYIFISMFQFGLLLFVAPALTAGAISGERERQTLEILLSTPLRPWRILVGKLLSSISTIVLLIVASTPILAIIFIFGGVSIAQLFGLIGYYVITAIFIGSIGIFISTLFKRTTASNVVTYAIVLALAFGTLIFSLFYLAFITRYQYTVINTLPDLPVPLYILYANPLTGFISVIVNQLGNADSFGRILVYDLGYKIKETIRINIAVEMVISVLLLGLASMRLNPRKNKLFKKSRNKAKA